MPEINILSPHVADLIAAGEVVERPASVVKELLENAFDANSKNISVELRGGGLSYIRVTDDGCGMEQEDAGIAFLRHATSKLSSERSLEAIGTFGFRGEALAAVSACSRLEIITRMPEAESGCRVVLEAGDIIRMEPCGCPVGTTVIVRDLFFNTPARRKFLKSERAEASACVNLALRCALGLPHVSIRLEKDGEEVFFSPGDGDLRSCMYSLLGRETASMLSCETERDGVRVRGFVSSPANGRGSRAMQYFYCNGRAIRSLTLQTALERAYKNTLLTGRFPACVLYVELSPGAVDVNVHPTKAEVRFSNEKAVSDGVYYAALAAISAERRVPVPEVQNPDESPAAPAAEGVRFSAGEPFERALHVINLERRTDGEPEPARPTFAAPLREPVALYESSPVSPLTRSSPPPEAPVSLPGQEAPESGVSLVGEAFGAYIIVESGASLVFIDKHAAHERLIFERLKNEGAEIMSQLLLSPRVIRTDGETVDVVAQNGELLSKLGFELEPFGETELILRALPSYAFESDAEALVEEVCEKLRLSQGAAPLEMWDELIHTIACKSAIKAGDQSDDEELVHIAKRVMEGDVKYCPHGRPVSFVVGKKDLDKQFKRIL